MDDKVITALRPAGMPKRRNELVPPASGTRCGNPEFSDRVAIGYTPNAAPPEKRSPGKMLRKFHDGVRYCGDSAAVVVAEKSSAINDTDQSRR